MPTILHFADAHIDMMNYGRHDPKSGLPMRVVDFLDSLDVIIDAAIREKVDLVLFAGDAYRDRNPAPTFQREWGKRIMRLARARIPTLLLIGNHDLSPALGRAHALEAFDTLEVPYVRVLDKPQFLDLRQDASLKLQVIAIPWVSRAGLIAQLGLPLKADQVYAEIEKRLADLVQQWLKEADPEVPTILCAHGSVQGAVYGQERSVMLGGDLVLPGSLVRDPRLDYVALGHIHKPQDLNEGGHPPVVYPGSIERVDLSEAADDKFYVIAHVERSKTTVEWRKLEHIRPMIYRRLNLDDVFANLERRDQGSLTEYIRSFLPPAESLEGAIFALRLEYPKQWEAMIDPAALRQYASACFEFRLELKPQLEARLRLPDDRTMESLSPMELLGYYWKSIHLDEDEAAALNKLAEDILADSSA